MAKVRAQKMPSVSLVKGLDPGRAAEHGFQIRKDREGIEVGMHKGEIFDIRQVSGIRRNSDLQIRKLFAERVAPRPGVADMLVEINDEQRRGWFLSYSVRLWRGRSVRSRYHL